MIFSISLSLRSKHFDCFKTIHHITIVPNLQEEIQLEPNSEFQRSSSSHLLLLKLGLITPIDFRKSSYLSGLTCINITHPFIKHTLICERSFKRGLDYGFDTLFAWMVRISAPSSRIGIIAASSHNACRSLPEYPVT